VTSEEVAISFTYTSYKDIIYLHGPVIGGAIIYLHCIYFMSIIPDACTNWSNCNVGWPEKFFGGPSYTRHKSRPKAISNLPHFLSSVQAEHFETFI